MTMENEGERPDEGSEPEDSERWYFDLPSGAWERQEAKNRELRKRVRGKFEDVEAEPPVSDPFAPSSSSEPKPAEGKRRWGLRRGKNQDADTEAAEETTPPQAEPAISASDFYTDSDIRDSAPTTPSAAEEVVLESARFEETTREEPVPFETSVRADDPTAWPLSDAEEGPDAMRAWAAGGLDASDPEPLDKGAPAPEAPESAVAADSAIGDELSGWGEIEPDPLDAMRAWATDAADLGDDDEAPANVPAKEVVDLPDPDLGDAITEPEPPVKQRDGLFGRLFSRGSRPQAEGERAELGFETEAVDAGAAIGAPAEGEAAASLPGSAWPVAEAPSAVPSDAVDDPWPVEQAAFETPRELPTSDSPDTAGYAEADPWAEFLTTRETGEPEIGGAPLPSQADAPAHGEGGPADIVESEIASAAEPEALGLEPPNQAASDLGEPSPKAPVELSAESADAPADDGSPSWGEGSWLARNFPERDPGEETDPEPAASLSTSPLDIDAVVGPERLGGELGPSNGKPPAPALWVAAEERDERDLIVKAFEAHAATEQEEGEGTDWDVPEPKQAPGAALRELLGEDGERLVSDPQDGSSIDEAGLPVPGWDRQRTVAAPESAIPLPFGQDDGSGDGAPPWETTAPAAGSDDTRRRHRRRTMVRELVETGLLALLVFLSVRAGLQNFRVEGLSMYPTLEDSQYIIVNKLIYSEINLDRLNDFVPFIEASEGEQRHVFHGPERGDIVVFASPTRADEDLIKRVVGLPGETVEILNGRVFINDFLLEEPYVKQDWRDTRAKILIPDGQYYVMGDNRNNSQDSRSAHVGLVPEDLIIGKAMLSYWPPSSFGFAPNGGANVSEASGRPVVTTMAIRDFQGALLTP